MRSDIKNRILHQQVLAKTETERLLSAAAPTPALAKECVYRYICYKFLLDPENSRGLSLHRMAEKSIEQSFLLHIPLAKEGETATTCGAAGSTGMKIALLLNAICRDFQADIPRQDLVFVKTPDEVAENLWNVKYCG